MTVSVEWTDATDPDGNVCQEFRIKRDGKRDITGALWLPEGASGDTLFCMGHGGSGHRYQIPQPALAKRFTQEGYPTLAIDGPDHGLRQHGVGGVMGLMQDVQRPEALDDMADDWDTAIDIVRARDDVDAPKLAYYGLSMGTIFGIPMLARRNDVVAATLGLWGAHERLPASKTIEAAAGKLSCPVLFIMQLEDETMSREGYLKLFDGLGSKNKRIHANPGLHAFLSLDEVAFAGDFMLGHAKGTLADPVFVDVTV